MEPAIIIAIISLCVSVILGLWNYKITVENHHMRKDEYVRNKKKEEKEIFDKRPKFEVISYTKKFEVIGYDNSKYFDFDCLVIPIKDYKDSRDTQTFIYDDTNLNKSDWVSIEFELKNIGLSAIDHLYLSYNAPKSTSMFDVKNNECDNFVKYGLLNYRVILDKKINTSDKISIRINFHKDWVSYKFHSAEASIWMLDEYNNHWSQPVFIHQGKLYDSSLKTYKEFQNQTNIKDALACFKEPYLW